MTGMFVRSVLCAVMSLLVLAGCQGVSRQSATGWYDAMKFTAPHGQRAVICHGFGCEHRTAVVVSADDQAKLAAILLEGKASPAGERAAIAKAVMWFEKRVGPVVGSTGDVGGFDMSGSGVRGQMDCIDESTNTTTLLLMLERFGMLKHHTVGRPVARGFFLDGRYPHATAVVHEKQSKRSYAIDPWPYGNGENVDVMPLETWMKTWPTAS